MTTTAVTVRAVPLTRHIGAEIQGVDLREPLDAETAAELKRLWLQHVVILFRDQHLSQADQLRVTGYFGTPGMVSRPKEFRPSGYAKLLDGIMLISNIRENGEPIGALPDGEMMFHHDMIHQPVPDKGTFLYAVEIPSTGGHTLFANCYTAYETMPRDVRSALEGKKAFHRYNYGSVQRDDNKGTAAYGQCIHPVFRTNEDTNRKA